MRTLTRLSGRFLLRFFSFYWICFIFPFPIDLIGVLLQPPDTSIYPAWLKAAGAAYGEASFWLFQTEREACKWVGKHVLDVDVVVQPTGSGDTMRAYVGCFCAAGIAFGLAVLWSLIVLIQRRLKPAWQADAVLHATVRILLRFFLFKMLLGYGFAKVFPLQFAQPSSSRLTQQLGDMSPMGLLWTFMGFSPAYQMFTGAIELLGGILLTMRRTTLLGALVTIVAMTQIFALNMCFDVPVKLYSFHYLVMAIFLTVPDLPRLVSILALGRAAEARPLLHPLDSVKLGWTWTAIDFMNKALLRSFASKPPNVIHQLTWKVAESKFSLKKFSAPDWSADFTYALPEPDKLQLQGSMGGKRVTINLKSAPTKQYELMTRGFHWIQELPYNR